MKSDYHDEGSSASTADRFSRYVAQSRAERLSPPGAAVTEKPPKLKLDPGSRKLSAEYSPRPSGLPDEDSGVDRPGRRGFGSYAAIHDARSHAELSEIFKPAFGRRAAVIAMFVPMDALEIFVVCEAVFISQHRTLLWIVLPVIYSISTLVAVSAGSMMAMPPVRGWKALHSAVAAGLRAFLAAVEIVDKCWGLQVDLYRDNLWTAFQIVSAFVLLALTVALSILSVKAFSAIRWLNKEFPLDSKDEP